MNLKSQHVDQHSHPPLRLTLPSTPSAGDISSSFGNTRFDVILLRPLDTWQKTAELPVRSISADPGFVFLWVGKGDDEGLERGRECFAKWGFRRAEDIVWVKTNKSLCSEKNKRDGAGGDGLFASSKEHCLMGIRGTVRRSTDSRFVHCNVDTDIIVYEGTDGKYSRSLALCWSDFRSLSQVTKAYRHSHHTSTPSSRISVSVLDDLSCLPIPHSPDVDGSPPPSQPHLPEAMQRKPIRPLP